ncbi:helix-turn-helix transcriptional regulator [Agrobacterium tumefaciens]|uniref:helix-turn-helix domain-containing protein n=1 Tax=Agrobacterium radiobacter TaxID=362 RepID=UPI000FA2BFD5|nr:helix-turn-helix transcriptional regulator [Agrobacterium tumefaciens]
MKLETYLKTNGISHSEFGRKLNVSQATISRYVADERRPSLAMAKKIQDATGNMVPLAEWFPELRSAVSA